MHPSILKASSNDEYSLNSLILTDYTALASMPDDAAYLNQAVLFGPDAAIQLKDGRMTLFMDGVVTDNTAFMEFVDKQKSAVQARAKKLRKHRADTVTFLGKWYHVHFDLHPFFRPYVIRISRHDGTTEHIASKKDVFWTDEDNEYYKYDFIESSALAHDPKTTFQEESEHHIRGNIGQPSPSGFHSFGGFLWHPTVEGYPIVYVPLEGVVTHRAKNRWRQGQDVDPAYVGQFKVVDQAICDFKLALRHASQGKLSDEFLDAYVRLEQSVATMSGGYERSEAHNYLTALLGDRRIDVDAKMLIEKADLPSSERIKLQQIPIETKANGYWIIHRYGPGEREIGPEFQTFLSGIPGGGQEVILQRCRPIQIDGFDQPCVYASDWVPYEHGDWRCLAFGPERSLSW